METAFLNQCRKDFKSRSQANRLGSLRRKAFDSFLDQGLPSSRDESWKYTSIDPVAKVPFQFTPLPPVASQTVEGAWIGSFEDFLKERPQLFEKHFASRATPLSPWIALNAAFSEGGTVVYLPEGTIVKEPIPLVTRSTGGSQSTVSYPRNLIIAESGSQAVVLEHHLGSGNYFTDAVTEISLGAGSSVEHYKLQEEGESACHLSHLEVQQERDSHFTSHLIMVGARWSRSEIRSVLAGKGAECTLNGLYSVGGEQHVDNQTSIDHTQPHGTSRETYKGILDGKSTAVFNGKIIVRPDAQKTNARQINKNLLLSDDAIVNTKPLLEILANDVKCNHGATIGRLDENQIFYLRSRGLGDEEARGLLTFAFANELLSRMKWKPFCLRFQEKLFTHLTQRHLPSLEEIL